MDTTETGIRALDDNEIDVVSGARRADIGFGVYVDIGDSCALVGWQTKYNVQAWGVCQK